MDAAVFLDLGERLTKALVTGDFDLYRQVMNVPIQIEPRGDKPCTLDTEEALRRDFDLYRDHIRLHRITDIHREVIEVERPDEDTAIAIVRMNILSDAQRVVPPFISMMTMRRGKDGVVRFHKIQSSLGHINWTLGKGGITEGDFDPPRPGTTRNTKPNGGSNG